MESSATHAIYDTITQFFIRNAINVSLKQIYHNISPRNLFQNYYQYRIFHLFPRWTKILLERRQSVSKQSRAFIYSWPRTEFLYRANIKKVESTKIYHLIPRLEKVIRYNLQIENDIYPPVKILLDEILRRFKYLEPESREQMAEKLNDLLVYAEVAKALRSELIAIIVLSKLRKWENLLLQKHLGKWIPFM